MTSNPFFEGAECQVKDLDQIYFAHFGDLRDGWFVEVGAFDGYTWSNTSPLAQIGWSGLLIEPQPVYAAKCRQRYATNPRIHIKECAVGSPEQVAQGKGRATLYLGGSLSTIKTETVETYSKLPWSQSSGIMDKKQSEVALCTLDSLLDEFSVPIGFDVLVIDVEGAELDVLEGFSLPRYLPKMAIIETHAKYPDRRLNFKAPLISGMFKPLGYRVVYEDHVNTVYARDY